MNWPALLLLVAVLFGGLVRFMPVLVTRFPINDGGMFLDMTRDLQANGYLLPATTTYNGLDLPYAYPPLGFYVTSLLSDLGRIPLLDLFIWLPPLLSTLTIPAFYLLARALLADDLRASLAAIFFALTPGGYSWHIMGGGITRALGLLFLLLGAVYVHRMFSSRTQTLPRSQYLDIILATLFCSLAVLSHPEIAVHTAGLCAILWLFQGRAWRKTIHAAIVAVGVLMLTSPWWGTVLAQHGAAPFLSASQTGLHSTASWSKFFTDNFSLSGIFPFLLILRVVGVAYAFVGRNWLLLVLLAIPYIVDPRSAPAISYLGLSMVSALALIDAVPELISRLRKSQEPVKPLLEMRVGVVTLFALIFLQLIDCGLFNYRLINTTLTPADRDAMAWVQANLPPGNDFLIITAKTYSMSDPVQEWFPTFTGQHSQTTLQGLEWNLDGEFINRLEDLVELQECADLACVESWSTRTGLSYDYLWVSIYPDENASKPYPATAGLLVSVKASDNYRLIYESENVAIFARVEK